MNRRNLPLILMLVAGAVICIINLVRNYSILHSLIALFGTLILFFALGSVMKCTLDYFERENERKRKEEEQQKEDEAQDGEEEEEHSEEEA